MHLRSGTSLQSGKYRIEKVLGQGGFGITYLAEQVSLHRKVAVKEFFMKEYCNRDTDTSHVSVPSVGSIDLVKRFKEKFVKEAQNIAGFNHNNIIRIYDVFEENDTAYYVMEYLENGSLSDYLAQKVRLSENEAVGFIIHIANALSYIHKCKVNHFDVKPGNILLDNNNNAILIDFGVSKHYDNSGKQTTSSPIGHSMGYAPLEQSRNGGITEFSPESDIYALGATLYKLLTGITPPVADEVNENGLRFPEDITLSDNVRNTIIFAMQPRRKDRPQCIEDFLKSLDGKYEKVNVMSDSTDIENVEISPIAEKEIYVIQEEQTSMPSRKNKWWLWLLMTILTGMLTYFVIKIIMKKEYVDVDDVVIENVVEYTIIPEDIRETPATEIITVSIKTDNEDEIVEEVEIIPSENIIPMEITPTETDNLPIPYNRKETITVNGVSFNMIRITGGTFRMETEKHGVLLMVDDYYIAETEVTQKLWNAVMGTTVSQQRDKVNESWMLVGAGDQYPMYFVSWDECQDFIDKLNAITGKKFRLPTESEWEFAARGGNKSKNNKFSGNKSLDQVGWYTDNSRSQTHEVKTKSPNELGIYDMSGNVAEWCRDSETSGKRVLRGGGWDSSNSDCTVSSRSMDYSTNRRANYGFRLAY